MAIPHTIMRQIIEKRIKGKEGKAKLEEIRQIESELPGYNNGPYGELKKWLHEEIQRTKIRSKIKHQDWLGVERKGNKQYVLVGLPSVGKSSLINKLCGLQTKIADYEFTTLKPIPGIVIVNHAEFQIIDLPGLIEGANNDEGGGRRLLGIVKCSDGIILMHDLTKPFEKTEALLKELEIAHIEKPMIIVGSKNDIAGADATTLKTRFPNKQIIEISVTTGQGIETFKQTLWNMSGLIRIKTQNETKPLILVEGSTVKNLVAQIHKQLLKTFRFARVSGTSVKFPKQQVGLTHILEDNDEVEIITNK